MNTPTTLSDQAAEIGYALNNALADTGMQVHWSEAKQRWGYWIQVTPTRREFQACSSLETAVAACIEIHARRKHAIYRDHALSLG